MSKQLALVFAFFLFLVLFFFFFVSQDVDAKYMQMAFKTNSLEGFRFPLLYYVTLPFYSAIGEKAFLVLPLLLFFGALAFLIKIVELAGLKAKWIIPLLLVNFVLFMFVIYYTRDSLNFFLASAFAYYFLQYWYFKKSIIPSTALCFTMFFANPQSIALFFLVIYSWFIRELDNGFPLFYKMAIIPIAGFKKLFDSMIQQILSFQLSDLYYFYLPFHNYFIGLSLVCFLFNRDSMFLLVLVLAVLVSGISVWVTVAEQPDANPEQLAARYGLEFVPLLLFFVAETFKEKMGDD